MRVFEIRVAGKHSKYLDEDKLKCLLASVYSFDIEEGKEEIVVEELTNE